MVASPRFTLRKFKDTLGTQLDSWTMYIPGVGSSKEVKDLKLLKSIVEAMTDAELDNHDLINGVAKVRIAAAAGATTDDVARLLWNFKNSMVLAAWLQLLKKQGEPFPKTEQELLYRQENDLRFRRIAMKILKPTKPKSNVNF